MSTCPQKTTVLSALAAVLVALPAAVPAQTQATTLSPLPASDYSTHHACPPASVGYASCLADQLVPRTAEAQARRHPLGLARAAAPAAPSPLSGSYGLRPQDLHSVYQLPTSGTGTQTIALVDAYNDPTAESDLKGYDEEFSLPACTTANGCFRQVNQNGGSSELPFPRTTAELEAARTSNPHKAEEATGWGVEISLDIETARAVCQSCHILLVEASSPAYGNLETAEHTAASLGAGEISNSWGGPEIGETPTQESTSAFNHPGTVITASAGDYGYLGWDAEAESERGYAEFPASSPHVVAVGGTRLSPLGAGGTWTGETVWNGSGAGGGGCSVEFTAPAWQQALADWSAVGCADKRAVADVAADGDPYSGLAVHDTSPACKHESEYWCTIGGTSLSSPLIAAVFALAGGAGAASYPAHTLYQEALAVPSSLHDVTSGSNGECLQPFNEETGLSGCTPAEEAATSCSSKLICLAGSGYDGPSGLGTPNGLAAFHPAGESSGKEQTEAGGGTEEAKSGGSGGGAPPPAPEGGSGSGAATGSTASGASSSSASSGATSATGSAASATPNVSSLALTLRALIALNHSRPKVSQVAFTFTLNVAASVRVTLTQRGHRNKRTLWRQIGRSLTFSVNAGPVARHLQTAGVLARGLYRLTVAPVGGSSRTLQFQIG
jgi:hypothetical protein